MITLFGRDAETAGLARLIDKAAMAGQAIVLVGEPGIGKTALLGAAGELARAALASVLDGDPYRRTWHRAQSVVGPDDEVADELEANVAVALRRGAVMSAIADLRRAAELTSSSARRGRRLLTAAEHAFGLGRVNLVDEL